ncbi:hypothetical protein [Maritalea sp.]|uniref:hypothetical protein n=1 Tax=Maritalea sp. TaxID=2003361 RepID=UPI003EF9D0BD
MTKKLRCTQAEVSRVIKGIQRSGEELARLEIDQDGKIIAILGRPTESQLDNPWDEELR